MSGNAARNISGRYASTKFACASPSVAGMQHRSVSQTRLTLDCNILGCVRNRRIFRFVWKEPKPIFYHYLTRHCVSYIRNREQLQSSISRFCGHYCVFYCLFKRLNYSMKDIVNCFSNDTSLNDFIAHKFVCENL